MRAPGAEAHQPIAAIQRRAENSIRPSQGAKPGSDISGAKARDIAADQDGAWEGRHGLFHAAPQITSNLAHAWRTGRRQAPPIRPRPGWCDGQNRVPPTIPRNGPGSGRQHAPVKAQGAACTDARGQASLHRAKAWRAGEDDYNRATHPISKADQRRCV
jgi:hypothetical protein